MRTTTAHHSTLTAQQRLDTIAHLISPCPPPDVYAGYDLCVCGYGGTFPCPTTKAAWHAQGLDLQTALHEALNTVRPNGPGIDEIGGPS